MIYLAIFDQDCEVCGESPCVGIQAPDAEGVRSTGVCGPHFFRDRSMWDWKIWNEPQESTE